METKKRRKKPVKRTPESYRKEVEEITNGEYSVLEDFINTKTGVLHVHNSCGHSWKVQPNNFVNVGSRCPKCSGQLRLSPEDYRREISVLTGGEYSVLGEFVNTTTNILHVHNVCGYEWDITRNSFVHGGNRCPKCSTRMRRTADSYRKEVSELTGGEYSVLGRYINVKSKITHKHIGCGYEWVVAPNHFVNNGSRCPKCSKRVRRTTEEYRNEVEDKTNGEYSVLGEYVNVKTKILHVHNVCGFEWETSPANFINNGSRCLKCYARSRVSHTPESYREEVSEITGGEYLVLDDFKDSISKIKHLHSVCDHVWEIAPSNFVRRGTRCPKCSTTRKTEDQFVSEVFNLVGDEYTFLDPYVNSITNLRVRHNTCGHVWKLQPSNFTSKSSRCPNCIYSRGEKAVAVTLDSLNLTYLREHSFDYLGMKRYDFFIPSLNIAIEYDGVQHFEAIEFWGGDVRLKETQESDALKNGFCDYMGIDLLRIPYWDFDNIDEIVSNFIDTVNLMRSISDRKEA